MAHFAELDNNNIVVRVIVVADENEADGENWCRNLLGGFWKKTSYNTQGGVHLTGGTPFRKNYAGIGYKYDPDRDAFVPPKPFNSWVLNETTCVWDPPTPMPSDGKLYRWDEDTLAWVEMPDVTPKE